MSRAVMTMVFNERVFLPIWLGYYSRYFAAEDMYVIDHGSTDGSTEREGFVRIPIEHEAYGELWRVQVVESQHRELLKRYDAVLATDVDEIVAADPDRGTLGDYIDGFERDAVSCTGYEVLHRRDVEPPFDPARPVLRQRGSWYRNPGYDKPLLTTAPISWGPGFHVPTDGVVERDPELRMIHLHRMDFEICLRRHRARRERSWSPEDVETGRSYHHRISEEGEFEHWFYNDSCFESMGVSVEPEPVPERWRGVV